MQLQHCLLSQAHALWGTCFLKFFRSEILDPKMSSSSKPFSLRLVSDSCNTEFPAKQMPITYDIGKNKSYVLFQHLS